MRKKILNHTCILVVVSVLLTFLAAGLVMYGKYNEDLKESVLERLLQPALRYLIQREMSCSIRWRILQNLKITVTVRNLFRQRRMDTRNH